MSNQYVNEYLRLIQVNVDPEACLDSKGNVVYVQQVLLEPSTIVHKVTPEQCEDIINQLRGADEYEQSN